MLKEINPRTSWLENENIRPYVFVRPDNRIDEPGSSYKLDWFSQEPIRYNPLRMEDIHFANQILFLEEKAFAISQMAMPRWVFYDCAVIPGYIAGFCYRTEALPKSLKELLQPDMGCEWTPISLFIVIPTMAAGEWVAHNLCSVNSLLPSADRLYGLGFLTKAFALWFANIDVCCGMTQWQSPAIKLHSHYGEFEVLTAYTPCHDYAKTLTYRLRVNTKYWPQFFTKQPNESFEDKYQNSGLTIDPLDENSLIDFQWMIEQGEGPFYLRPSEVREQNLSGPLTIYRLRT